AGRRLCYCHAKSLFRPLTSLDCTTTLGLGRLSPAKSGEYPAQPGGGGVSHPQGRGSTRRSRGRGGGLSPARSGEYPAQPGEGACDPQSFCRLESASEVGRRLFEELGELALRRLFPRRDMLAWQPALGLLVVAQDVSRDRLSVHLVRAVV